VAARLADPAVQQSVAVDLARSDHDDHRRTALARAMVHTANQHDAHTFYRRRAGPGIGQRLRLVRRDAIHAIRRWPRGPECVSSGRLVTCATASAGTGQAVTMLAHPLARAVYDRRKRDRTFARHTFLTGSWRGAGEPSASLDDTGSSLDLARCQA
jgi:hypothetical protein